MFNGLLWRVWCCRARSLHPDARGRTGTEIVRSVCGDVVDLAPAEPGADDGCPPGGRWNCRPVARTRGREAELASEPAFELISELVFRSVTGARRRRLIEFREVLRLLRGGGIRPAAVLAWVVEAVEPAGLLQRCAEEEAGVKSTLSHGHRGRPTEEAIRRIAQEFSRIIRKHGGASPTAVFANSNSVSASLTSLRKLLRPILVRAAGGEDRLPSSGEERDLESIDHVEHAHQEVLRQIRDTSVRRFFFATIAARALTENDPFVPTEEAQSGAKVESIVRRLTSEVLGNEIPHVTLKTWMRRQILDAARRLGGGRRATEEQVAEWLRREVERVLPHAAVCRSEDVTGMLLDRADSIRVPRGWSPMRILTPQTAFVEWRRLLGLTIGRLSEGGLNPRMRYTPALLRGLLPLGHWFGVSACVEPFEDLPLGRNVARFSLPYQRSGWLRIGHRDGRRIINDKNLLTDVTAAVFQLTLSMAFLRNEAA